MHHFKKFLIGFVNVLWEGKAFNMFDGWKKTHAACWRNKVNVNDSENTPMAAFKSPLTENPAANFTKKGINFSTFPLLKISVHVCLKDIFVQECSSRLSD